VTTEHFCEDKHIGSIDKGILLSPLTPISLQITYGHFQQIDYVVLDGGKTNLKGLRWQQLRFSRDLGKPLESLLVAWLRHYATSWKVISSISNEVTGFFN
jgi:hypothetical protein